jgi:hypothetical protein
VHGQNLAQRNITAAARIMAYLGGAGAHACESGRAQPRHDAKRPTYTKARNPDGEKESRVPQGPLERTR